MQAMLVVDLIWAVPVCVCVCVCVCVAAYWGLSSSHRELL